MVYQIAVIGNADETHINKSIKKIAFEVGQEIAKSGSILICGGMGGIMEYAAKGAKSNGGIVTGIIPFINKKNANNFCDVIIGSGMEISLRSSLIVHSADAVIVVGGGAGTLAEIATAYMYNIPIILVKNTHGWADKLEKSYLDKRKKTKIIQVDTPKKAVELAIKKIKV